MYERETLRRILRSAFHLAFREEPWYRVPITKEEEYISYAISDRTPPYIFFTTDRIVPSPGVEGTTKIGVDFQVICRANDDGELDAFERELRKLISDQFINIISESRDVFVKADAQCVRPFTLRVMSAGANPELAPNLPSLLVMAPPGSEPSDDDKVFTKNEVVLTSG